jgi:steroid 5-alpha reductase family enzyme
MAFSGFVTIASMPSLNFVAQAQALCFILYGLRLSAFLMYREINIPDIFRRESKGNPVARLPTILGCSLLYLAMAAPLRLASQAGAFSPSSQLAAYAGLFLMYAGWAVAAIGDYQKTAYKAQNGNGLVTQGLFSVLRHPNYTGEQACTRTLLL